MGEIQQSGGLHVHVVCKKIYSAANLYNMFHIVLINCRIFCSAEFNAMNLEDISQTN